MDYTNAALTYGLLFIPALFALSIVGQGITKLKKQDESGKGTIVLGILFLLLIPVGYFLFIRV